MTKSPKSANPLVRIRHQVPGRTRIKLHKRHKKEHARLVREKLLSVPGVERVDYNERTGSMIVHHHDHPEMSGTITATAGELANTLVGLVAEAEQAELAGLLLLAGMLLSGVSRMMKEQVFPERQPGVVHHSKRRTRLKLHHHHHSHEHMSALKQKLEAVPGVHQVNYNHRTGNVVIHHDGSHETLTSVGGVVKDFSLDLFSCIVKHEDPALAGIHLFAEALANGGANKEEIAHGLALMMVAIMMSDGLVIGA